MSGLLSERKLAIIRLMFDIIREESDPLATPKEFNEKLAREMMHKGLTDLSDLTAVQIEEGSELSQHLTSPEINFVLETLKDANIWIISEKKKQLNTNLNRMPADQRKMKTHLEKDWWKAVCI